MSRYLFGKQALFCWFFLFATSANLWVLRAQDPFGGDDPFGGVSGDDPFGATPGGEPDMGFGEATFGADAAPRMTTPGMTDIPIEDPDPVVRLIRSSPPETPQQWSDALTWVIRIQRWDEAKRLLEELRQANWSVEQQSALARAGGATLWMRLRVDEAELSPEQLQMVRDIAAAPGKLARDPSAIEGWIQALAQEDSTARRRAQLRLQDSGLVGVERLINHLLLGDTTASPAVMVATLVGFGPDGHDALRAACLVRNPEGAARVYAGMAESEFKLFAAELGSGLAGRVLNDAAQADLVSTLSSRLGTVPQAAAVHTFLSKQFATAVENYQQQRHAPAGFGAWVWRPAADGQTVTVTQAALKEQMLERAAQLAAHRMLLKAAVIDDLVDSSVVLLQRAYQRDPNLPLGDISQHMLASFDQSVATNADYWQQVLRRSDALQMHGAALRGLQLMTEHAVQGDIAPPLDSLTGLLRDARPNMRYTALAAIARLDPQVPFGGAELAVETAVEMVGLGSGPQTIVIGHDPGLREAATDILAQLSGQQPISVGTGRAALKELSGNMPIEMIIVSDRVSDLSLFELLQRVRNTRLGQSLPIAVLVDPLYQHERRWVESTPGVVSAPLTKNVEYSRQMISKLLSKLDTSPLSAEERGEMAVVAGQFLGKIAEQPEQYSFYPIADWSQRLLSTSNGISRSGQVAVLAVLGTADSQQRLAEMTVVTGLEADERLRSARAFGSSIRRFGTLISNQAVEQSYDLYNQLGPNDPDLAMSLGLILDYIEAQSGKIPWPTAE